MGSQVTMTFAVCACLCTTLQCTCVYVYVGLPCLHAGKWTHIHTHTDAKTHITWCNGVPVCKVRMIGSFADAVGALLLICSVLLFCFYFWIWMPPWSAYFFVLLLLFFSLYFSLSIFLIIFLITFFFFVFSIPMLAKTLIYMERNIRT